MSDLADEGSLLIAGMLVFVVVVFVLGGWAGDTVARKSEREAAIKAGVGRWVSDPATGTTGFVYGVIP